MYMYMYVYVYVYVYVNMYVYVNKYIYTCISYMHEDRYRRKFVHISTYMYIYIHTLSNIVSQKKREHMFPNINIVKQHQHQIISLSSCNSHSWLITGPRYFLQLVYMW